MRYFTKENSLKFYKDPLYFDKHTPKELLKYAIGANMYMAATRQNVFKKLVNNEYYDVGAITLCMEDAISEDEVGLAQDNVLDILDHLYEVENSGAELNLPLLFVRVRSIEQFLSFAKMLDERHVKVLCGFSFPKFNSDNGSEYFSILRRLSEKFSEPLYGMPIIEDKAVMYKESRFEELEKIQKIFLDNDDYMLNIRVGGTDFSSIYGLRRDVNTTIYDIKVVADCLKDILNFFLRQECRYVVAGPVWEYYSWKEQSPEISGLKKELALDIQNGFQGKTIIHPSQTDVVNKAYIVKYDEYQDALNVLNSKGGVFASVNGNRMNETNPHKNWASKIMARAEIFGVAEKDVIF